MKLTRRSSLTGLLAGLLTLPVLKYLPILGRTTKHLIQTYNPARIKLKIAGHEIIGFTPGTYATIDRKQYKDHPSFGLENPSVHLGAISAVNDKLPRDV